MNNLDIEYFEKIHYYKNVIENPYELVELIENTDSGLSSNTSITKWKRWIASDKGYEFGYQKSINESIIDETNESLVSINKQIRDAIYLGSKHYANYYDINIGYLTPISIAKYSTGKQMGSHIDSYGDERSPVLSVVLYLNDNYEGGELYFKEQDIKIKPVAGSLIAFPSVAPYFHQSMEVTKGVKYMSPGFWYAN